MKNPSTRDQVFRVPEVTGVTGYGGFTFYELDHGMESAAKALLDALTAPLPKREGGAQ